MNFNFNVSFFRISYMHTIYIDYIIFTPPPPGPQIYSLLLTFIPTICPLFKINNPLNLICAVHIQMSMEPSNGA